MTTGFPNPPFNLVRWPTTDTRYRTTGENGMYCYAAIHATDAELNTACDVDMRLELPEPDVCTSPNARDFWPLHGRGDRKPDDLDTYYTDNAPVWAAVFLGSTPATLARVDGGGYFSATCDDLLPPGLALFEALAAAYGGGVTLLTFLDT